MSENWKEEQTCLKFHTVCVPESLCVMHDLASVIYVFTFESIHDHYICSAFFSVIWILLFVCLYISSSFLRCKVCYWIGRFSLGVIVQPLLFLSTRQRIHDRHTQPNIWKWLLTYLLCGYFGSFIDKNESAWHVVSEFVYMCVVDVWSVWRLFVQLRLLPSKYII